MEDNDRMPGAQSDREGRNAPDPGTMPEEFVGDDSGNRFSPPPDPGQTEEDSDSGREND